MYCFIRFVGLEVREIVEPSAARLAAQRRTQEDLDTMQAAILLVKLRHLEEWTERRRANARIYQELLADIPEVHVPREADHLKPVYHTFVIQAQRRDELREYLGARGVETAIHYPVPIHLQSVGRALGYGPGDFPRAERQAGQILSLPVHHSLTPTQRDYIIAGVLDFAGARAETRAVAR